MSFDVLRRITCWQERSHGVGGFTLRYDTRLKSTIWYDRIGWRQTHTTATQTVVAMTNRKPNGRRKKSPRRLKLTLKNVCVYPNLISVVMFFQHRSTVRRSSSYHLTWGKHVIVIEYSQDFRTLEQVSTLNERWNRSAMETSLQGDQGIAVSERHSTLAAMPLNHGGFLLACSLAYVHIFASLHLHVFVCQALSPERQRIGAMEGYGWMTAAIKKISAQRRNSGLFGTRQTLIYTKNIQPVRTHRSFNHAACQFKNLLILH